MCIRDRFLPVHSLYTASVRPPSIQSLQTPTNTKWLASILHPFRCSVRRSSSAISVSYTHLDVYKRQSQHIAQGLEQLRSQIGRLYAAIDNLLQHGAVSYTHLDLIAEIDGRDTREIDIDNAVSRLRGQDGTEVTLKIISSDTILDTTIVRRTTEMQVVFSDMINATTGYIDVAEFSGTSTEDFRAALETVIEEGAEQLIIDVRGTPGGYISQVCLLYTS